jgi:GT2 family glycosyltransferase
MKKQYPLISVVMLNYNGLKYLKKTIPPILNLDYPNYEFVIVDNGSTDGSIDFIKRHKKIRLVENGENLGYSKGKNIGVKNARGEYVLLLDNDILIGEKETLKKFLDFHKKNDNVGFVSVPTLDYKRRDKKTRVYGLSYISRINYKNIDEILKNTPYIVGATTGQNIFFKKVFWEVVGGIDEIYPFNIDDYDLGARSWNLGYKNWILTSHFFLHMGEDRSSIENWCWKNQFYLSGYCRMMLKNYRISSLFLWFPLSILWITIKNLNKLIGCRDFRILESYIKSWYYFIRDLRNTIKLRRVYFSFRKTKEDLYLKIRL